MKKVDYDLKAVSRSMLVVLEIPFYKMTNLKLSYARLYSIAVQIATAHFVSLSENKISIVTLFF